MPHRILIVDDNDLNLDLVRTILQLEGYETDTADCGEAAVRKTQVFKPNVILLDVMMPDVNGFELCHHLRQLPDAANIPILMLTGASSEEDRLTAIEVGANGLLGKPFNIDTLNGRIKSLLK